MVRELRAVARTQGIPPEAFPGLAAVDYMRHGEPEALRIFPGVRLRATADVPASLVQWVRAIAPLNGTTSDDMWHVILASYLSRSVSPALEVESVATLALGREAA